MSNETKAPARQAAESGVLRFEGALIAYSSRAYGSFSVPLAEVAIVGELTTDQGPFVDDWFLVLVLRNGHWLEASMYAEGIQPWWGQLSAALGGSLYGTLFASTDFASRILWPVALADRPLFSFSPATAPGWLRRLKLSLLPEIARTLSPDALSVIRAI